MAAYLMTQNALNIDFFFLFCSLNSSLTYWGMGEARNYGGKK